MNINRTAYKIIYCVVGSALTKLIMNTKPNFMVYVEGQSEQLKCVWCGNDESKDMLPQLCNECFKKGCKAF